MVIKRKLTDEEFRSKLIIVNPNIEPLEAYSGAKNPLLCTCRVCGFTKKYRPDNLIYGNGCQRCGRRERYTTESYREKTRRSKFKYNTSQRIHRRCKESGL